MSSREKLPITIQVEYWGDYGLDFIAVGVDEDSSAEEIVAEMRSQGEEQYGDKATVLSDWGLIDPTAFTVSIRVKHKDGSVTHADW